MTFLEGEREAFHFCSGSLPGSGLGQSGICQKLWEKPNPSQARKRRVVKDLLIGSPVTPLVVQVWEEKGPEEDVKTEQAALILSKKMLTYVPQPLCNTVVQFSPKLNKPHFGIQQKFSSVQLLNRV